MSIFTATPIECNASRCAHCCTQMPFEFCEIYEINWFANLCSSYRLFLGFGDDFSQRSMPANTDIYLFGFAQLLVAHSQQMYTHPREKKEKNDRYTECFSRVEIVTGSKTTASKNEAKKMRNSRGAWTDCMNMPTLVETTKRRPRDWWIKYFQKLPQKK